MSRFLWSAVLLLCAALMGCSRARTSPQTSSDCQRAVEVDLVELEQGQGVRRVTADTDGQIFIDLTIARIPESQIDQALGAFRPVPASAHRDVPEKAVLAMATRWRESLSIEILSAPKILALPGQKATVFIGETVRFSKTKAETNESGGLEFSIVEEEDSSISLGEHIVVVANPREDRTQIALEFDASWTDLEGDDTHTVLTKECFAEIKKRVREHKVSMSLNVKSGAWTLFGDPQWIDGPNGRSLRFILMRAVVLGKTRPVD